MIGLIDVDGKLPNLALMKISSFYKSAERCQCGEEAEVCESEEEADWLNKDSDYFLDVSEKWMLDSFGCDDEWNPGFATMNIISKWKPLALPPNDNERILLQIEKWFED